MDQLISLSISGSVWKHWQSCFFDPGVINMFSKMRQDINGYRLFPLEQIKQQPEHASEWLSKAQVFLGDVRRLWPDIFTRYELGNAATIYKCGALLPIRESYWHLLFYGQTLRLMCEHINRLATYDILRSHEVDARWALLLTSLAPIKPPAEGGFYLSSEGNTHRPFPAAPEYFNLFDGKLLERLNTGPTFSASPGRKHGISRIAYNMSSRDLNSDIPSTGDSCMWYNIKNGEDPFSPQPWEMLKNFDSRISEGDLAKINPLFEHYFRKHFDSLNKKECA